MFCHSGRSLPPPIRTITARIYWDTHMGVPLRILIDRFPGKPWEKTVAMKGRFEILW